MGVEVKQMIRGRLEKLPLPPVPRWVVIPAALGCTALLAGGMIIGTAVGNDPNAAGTTVLKVVQPGTVVTHNGVKKIVIPARTVTSHGRTVTLPAQTMSINHTSTAEVFIPGRTFVRNGTTVRLPGTTTTVTHTTPPTTITTVVTSVQTTTATVVSTITLPGTTVTITVTQTGTT